MRLEYGYMYQEMPTEFVGTETGADYLGFMFDGVKAAATQDHAAEILIGPPKLCDYKAGNGRRFEYGGADMATLKWPMVRIHFNQDEVSNEQGSNS